MEIFGAGLIYLGILFLLIGGIWFLITAFRQSIWWGLGCFFIPIIQIFFLIIHWRSARQPFLLQLGAFVMLLIGFYVSPQTLRH